MKFTIDTQLLKDSVSIVSRASSSSNVSPILENILIDVQSDRVRFVANNTEFAIEKVITEKVEIESEGSFTMSTRFLSSYVSLQTSETVTIEHVKGDSLKFSTQSSKTEMKGLDAKKFPPLPTFTDGQPFKVNSSELKKAFNHTIFSVSSPDVRPTLA